MESLAESREVKSSLWWVFVVLAILLGLALVVGYVRRQRQTNANVLAQLKEHRRTPAIENPAYLSSDAHVRPVSIAQGLALWNPNYSNVAMGQSLYSVPLESGGEAVYSEACGMAPQPPPPLVYDIPFEDGSTVMYAEVSDIGEYLDVEGSVPEQPMYDAATAGRPVGEDQQCDLTAPQLHTPNPMYNAPMAGSTA